MTKRKVINPPKVKPADLRGIPDPSNASAEDIYQALNAETGGAVVRRLNAKLQIITRSNTQLREDNDQLARANVDLQRTERGLRADLAGMCTQDADHVKDLTALRVSIARVAQAAGVSLHYVGLPDDAQFAAIDKAAKEKLRGWNSLCAAIVDAIVDASKTLTDAGHEIARLRQQQSATTHKSSPADVIADAIEALRRIERARDYNAEHGHYPPEYEIRNDVCFDDWAADIASTILGKLAKR